MVYLVAPAIEQRLADAAPLAATDRAKLIGAISREVGSLPPTAQSPVILTPVTVRARLRREIEKEFPAVAVLSYQELSADMHIQPIARISTE